MKSKNNLLLGRLGEKEAEKYLSSNNYKIIARNFRTRNGEIDIVAQENNILVFVEVKSRGSAVFGPAELSLRERQRKNLVEAAGGYLLEKGIPGPGCSYRFDVILLHPPESRGKVRIEHIPDAFRA